MNVALIGASGNIGSKIQAELIARGHTVTAIARNAEKLASSAKVKVVAVDAADTAALANALRGHDAVIGSVPFAPGKMLKETLTLPDPIKKILDEAAAILARLRGEHELEWTFFSPAAEIGPGERTGKFRLGGDQLVTDANGKSRISYDDYAIALVDELERGNHIRKRFTIAY